MVSTLTPRQVAVINRKRVAATNKANRALIDIEWFINDVNQLINTSLEKRVEVATSYLKNKVIKNISIPVGRKKRSLSKRSKPGQFPRADTTVLMRTIDSGILYPYPGVIDGWVGSPQDYSLVLELKLRRSFLKKTLNQEKSKIRSIITAPIKRFK